MIETKPIQLALQVTLTADATLLAVLQQLAGAQPQLTTTLQTTVPEAPITPTAPEGNYLSGFTPVGVAPFGAFTPQAVGGFASVPVNAAPIAVAPPVVQGTAPTVSAPATPQAFTFDMLQTAAAGLAASGKQAAIAQLLAEFGIPALSQLPEASYGAFATALRGKGAKI